MTDKELDDLEADLRGGTRSTYALIAEAAVEVFPLERLRAMELMNAANRCDELERLAVDAHELIKRYRKETPLGHQPHMIAHIADEWLTAYQRKGE